MQKDRLVIIDGDEDPSDSKPPNSVPDTSQGPQIPVSDLGLASSCHNAPLTTQSSEFSGSQGFPHQMAEPNRSIFSHNGQPNIPYGAPHGIYSHSNSFQLQDPGLYGSDARNFPIGGGWPADGGSMPFPRQPRSDQDPTIGPSLYPNERFGKTSNDINRLNQENIELNKALIALQIGYKNQTALLEYLDTELRSVRSGPSMSRNESLASASHLKQENDRLRNERDSLLKVTWACRCGAASQGPKTYLQWTEDGVRKVQYTKGG